MAEPEQEVAPTQDEPPAPLLTLRSRAAIRRWIASRTFIPTWSPSRWSSPTDGYLLALALVIIASLITLLLVHLLPSFQFPAVFVFLAIVLIGLNWGLGPGLLASFAGPLIVDLAVLPPEFSWTLADAGDAAGIVLFIATGVIVSVVTSQAEYQRRQAVLLTGALHHAQRETALRAAEMDAAVEAIADAVSVYDATGNFSRVNAATRAMFGLNEHPSYLAMPLESRVRQIVFRDEHGRALPRAQLPQVRVLAGEVLTGDNTLDLQLRTLDGRDVQINVSGAPIRDPSDRITGGVLVVREVTERRKLERRTHETLNALLAMAQTLIGGDTDGGSDETNATPHIEVIGRRLAEMTRQVLGCRRVAITANDPDLRTARPIAQVGLTPEQEQHWREQLPTHTMDEYLDPATLQRLREDGLAILGSDAVTAQAAPFAVRSSLLVLLSVSGVVTGRLSIDYGDIEHRFQPREIALARAVARLAALALERERLLAESADLRATEMALREYNRRMDEFLGIASHELRTPVTSMHGFIQLAIRRLTRLQQAIPDGQSADVAKVRGVLEQAERQFTRLNRLIADLLDATRSQVGSLEMHLASCDLAVIVAEMVEEQRHAAPDRAIEMVLPGHPVPVQADTLRIGQVVTNYLTNALRYAPPGPPISVSLSVEGSHARLRVADQGPGLSPEVQDRVWDRFYRVHGLGAQPHVAGGLGLGLHISKMIVARHGGAVGVESSPGAGATFWFTLPLAVPLSTLPDIPPGGG